MLETVAEVLYRPESAEQRFLPEGPCQLSDNRISWVAIQHGGESKVGSLHILDPTTGVNVSHLLAGRPGFAFPTSRAEVFLIGLERRLILFDTRTGEETVLTSEIEKGVEGTIINDGALFDEGVVFGAKDLNFNEKKAGLYLWRNRDQALIKLRDDQICSNGKVILPDGERWRLLDIDSPTKTVVSYALDVASGELSEPEIVVDASAGDVFPDGMVATPEGQSVIVAYYNPHDAEFGEARQHDLRDGAVQAVWKTPAAPQVTCPLLATIAGDVKLVLTTAVEHMSRERQAKHANSGCLFAADAPFTESTAQPRFALS